MQELMFYFLQQNRLRFMLIWYTKPIKLHMQNRHNKNCKHVLFLESYFFHLDILWEKTFSLRSRRLEVAGERENGRARGRHARGEGASSPLACLLLARPFFLVPTTSKRLLRRLKDVQLYRQKYFYRFISCSNIFDQTASSSYTTTTTTTNQMVMSIIISFAGTKICNFFW